MAVDHGLRTKGPKPLPVPIDHPTEPGDCLIDLGRSYRTAIERADAESVCRFRWYANVKSPTNVYADGGPSGEPKRGLHVFLMEPPTGMIVDHVFGDKLDNRRRNLRVVTDTQNKRNNPGRYRPGIPYKGIAWEADRGYWRAMITVNGKSHFLGRFADAEQAARAYDQRAAAEFGEYARLNGV